VPIVVHSEFVLGDMIARYQAPADEPRALGLVILPAQKANAVVTPREHLDAPAVLALPLRWQPLTAWDVDPLIHVQLRRAPYAGGFSQGRTLRGGPASKAFRLREQSCAHDPRRTLIRTTVATGDGLVGIHELIHVAGEAALRVRTSVRNESAQPVTLELLTSFSLGGITPFARDDAPGRLWLHRFRSAWCAEGRLETRSLEELNLERSWLGHGMRVERCGQVGSMPTNGFFPFAAVEDRAAGVFWAAQLAIPGSWQMEISRRADQVAWSGGLADREFGHWEKQLQPGETFSAPEACVATAHGRFDEVCARLRSTRKAALENLPAVERDLPVVFNEWCTSWGAPSHANLIALADRLRGSGVRYLVIDDGWAERPGDGIQQNGDWIVNRRAFPDGLKATCAAIRERGLIPGLWFEFEVVNAGSRAWNETSHQLHRDGAPLQIGNRRFWDFRDPWVHAYLEERVIGRLRDNDFGYLKIDYNDSLGLGCDGAESPGEGLRQHLEGVQRFFRRLREVLPDLVIENCSSGGHRAEPSMMALTAMTSFSDAHETPDIPVIAANLNRLVCARQSQIWAVLRKEDSRQRLSYSLAATFLGRMCLSGDVHELVPEAWALVRGGIELYQKLAPVIVAARFERHGETGPSWQHLTGWQAVLAHTVGGAPSFLVWHVFAEPPGELQVVLSAGCAARADDGLCDEPSRVSLHDHRLVIPSPRPWSGGVILLS
jgi:alpha-galactosidase